MPYHEFPLDTFESLCVICKEVAQLALVEIPPPGVGLPQTRIILCRLCEASTRTRPLPEQDFGSVGRPAPARPPRAIEAYIDTHPRKRNAPPAIPPNR